MGEIINVQIPSKTNCIVVGRGYVVDSSTLRGYCQFCKKGYHDYGYWDGCMTPSYRSTHCENMPRGTEVLIHFNSQEIPQ